uniref:Pentatricopeptide repeat-containing protein n=1 Tax=Solanum tuberosum TaxID=4113 RepID=M1AFK9_SOLTU
MFQISSHRLFLPFLAPAHYPELFDLAIARYIAKPEKKELLLWLLKWMPGKGYAIDSSTRNLILKNSHLFGHQLIAESLSKHLVMSKKVKLHKENAR